MKTIWMGLNTEPVWFNADDTIRRWETIGDQKMVEYWKILKEKSLQLRDEIIQTIEEAGICRLSWSCSGRTRHALHALQWSEALPQYDFEIGDNYECIVRKRS